MIQINWERRFVRVWMVLSLLWLIFSSSIASLNINNYGEVHGDNLEWSSGIEFYLVQGAFVFLPLIIVLILGLVVRWIIKKPKTNNTSYHSTMSR